MSFKILWKIQKRVLSILNPPHSLVTRLGLTEVWKLLWLHQGFLKIGFYKLRTLETVKHLPIEVL